MPQLEAGRYPTSIYQLQEMLQHAQPMFAIVQEQVQSLTIARGLLYAEIAALADDGTDRELLYQTGVRGLQFSIVKIFKCIK